jgi:hypothetical protein
MPNQYLILKKQHQEEVNNFPMVFAFSEQQFEEAMEKLGLSVDDTDKIYSIGAGGYIRKTDSEALDEMFERHDREMKEAIDNDETGEGYIFDMFNYELSNHEYGYTLEVEPTLDALGLTMDDINNSKSLKRGLWLAHKAQTANI